ncbi:pulmonary surfactant-associated protein D-like [Megalops cyprinoides]|uniref:pulmonary surfactant-associated protein D-like n=1 Tax=Megalops cyprinoides TaxID=118141 RepID=UPI0018641D57|nr:pulmonary surfactant-associated protein D-like [Megalops cyprinoides]
MLRGILLILAAAGLHALPLPNNVLGSVRVQSPVPVEARRQGTQPSRAHIVDLRSGLPQNYVSEMDRRVGDYYVPPSTDQFRQGTQNSRAVLVDLRSGLQKPAVGEMQRNLGPVYVPPSLDGFRQGTQNSRAILVDPRTGLMVEPIGEMARTNLLNSESRAAMRPLESKQKCQGHIIMEKCYTFFPNSQTFEQAEATCQQLSPGGHLASVTSSDLHTRLISMVTEASNGPVLTWLGAALKVDKFQWIDGSPWSYSDWMPGYPSTRKDSEKCVEMFRIA